MKPTILVSECEGMSSEAIDELRTHGDVILADLDRAALVEQIRGAHVLWVRLRHQIDRELLDHARSLRLIASPTTGLDHIDIAASAEREIEIVSLRNSGHFLDDVRATAELTLALTLALLRKIPQASADVLQGNWDRDRFKGREICRKTVGVVGYGRLGRLVAGYMKALGAKVIASDPHVVTDDVPQMSLDDLMASCDIISIHVNLNAETTHLISHRQFERVRPNAILINTSRGDIVDDVALLDALASGRLAGAALDVLASERASGVAGVPLVEFARTHANLLITPHIGGCTYESMAMTELFLARRVTEALTKQARHE